jgi:hypothetical protein
MTVAYDVNLEYRHWFYFVCRKIRMGKKEKSHSSKYGTVENFD